MHETKARLPVLDFIILCSIVFMGVCNIAVFYSLHVYLQGLSFSKSVSGTIISLYSLSAMLMYATVSSSITVNNAFRYMFAGMGIVVLSGLGYLLFQGMWGLSLLRIAQGIGIFLTLAPCLSLLVSMLSTSNAGAGFSLYSTALLLPYSLLPVLSEWVALYIPGPQWLYAGTAGLIPFAFIMTLYLQHRFKGRSAEKDVKASPASRRESYANLVRGKILSVLAVNGVYFMLFTGLFFMFQDFAHSRDIYRAGQFFSMQMGVMILIRLFGGAIFDRFSKRKLIFIAFMITAAGFVLLLRLTGESMLAPVAVVFGIGMGLSAPALNSLMFTVSEPEYRSFNANMMMLTVHLGSFLGPLLGGVAVDHAGYHGFLNGAAAGTVGAAVLFLLVSSGRD